jgi:hypothetical protein
MVRLSAPSVLQGRIQGQVAQISEDSLTILNGGHPVQVPRRAIEQLDVSTGTHSQWLKGMIIGAVFEGVGLALTHVKTPDGQQASVGLGVFAGAAVGAGIGAFVHTPNWTPVPAERIHLSVEPTPHRGAAVSLTLGF